jgi:hypothetical protein
MSTHGPAAGAACGGLDRGRGSPARVAWPDIRK